MIKDKSFTLEQAQQRAKALCARQERCSFDIQKKLRQWHVIPADAEKIISKLIADKFIDDERYAQLFARDKSKFYKWGPIKIAYGLKSKNIPDEIIKSALSDIVTENDDQTLYDLLSKKAKTIKAKSIYDLKVKLIRFGIGRGFDYGKVVEIASSVLNRD
jgi:regulatory protein